ncbi:MAG: OmpA family protein [bacterium]|nr:OmpA family protein [bacterium]
MGKSSAAFLLLPMHSWLEAYLHTCLNDRDARACIGELLEEHRYQTAADGSILDKESLLLLFDRRRRAGMQTLLDGCRTRSGENFGMRGVSVEPTAEFPNILFDTGKATLKTASFRQIEEIAAGLQELRNARLTINGHTDKQPFAGVRSAEENLRLNMQLSKDRVAGVAQELRQRGIDPARVTTQGFNPTQPAVDEDTPQAYARNRRVVVEIY